MHLNRKQFCEDELQWCVLPGNEGGKQPSRARAAILETFPLNCPLMPAPNTTPHHWLSRPTSPSEDVMSGPGWQESWPGGATSLWSVSLLFTPLPFYSVFLNLSACFSLIPPSLLLFFTTPPHLILVSYLSICLPLNISDLSVLSLSPLSLNPQLSLSPLSWTPWPVVFVYITPDHQVRLSKYHHKN